VNVALGTDTYPMNFIAEMRWAGVLTRVADGNFQTPPDLVVKLQLIDIFDINL
jgi:hypothetical protein